MKKLFYVASLILVSSSLLAQNTFPGSGNVGIGTLTPVYNLDISSAATTTLQIRSTATTGYSNLIFKGSPSQWIISRFQSGTGPNATGTLDFGYWNGIYSPQSSYTAHAMTFYTDGTQNAKVIIGSNNINLLGDNTLVVAGKMGARGLVISNATPFPDYVFKPDYKLLPLSDVEKYIIKYSHLPGIPSAEEVNENGIEVGKMTNILVQKIEELTLHIIEMNKKIEKLERENEKINNTLKTRDNK